MYGAADKESNESKRLTSNGNFRERGKTWNGESSSFGPNKNVNRRIPFIESDHGKNLEGSTMTEEDAVRGGASFERDGQKYQIISDAPTGIQTPPPPWLPLYPVQDAANHRTGDNCRGDRGGRGSGNGRGGSMWVSRRLDKERLPREDLIPKRGMLWLSMMLEDRRVAISTTWNYRQFLKRGTQQRTMRDEDPVFHQDGREEGRG